MDTIKNKYEFILGFVGIAISLAAFKEELSKIIIDLGIVHFSLAEYFFSLLIGLLSSLYLFAVERCFYDTRLGRYKVFNYLTKTANIIFIFLILSPVLVFLCYVSNKIIIAMGQLDPGIRKVVYFILGMIIGMLSSFIASNQWIRKKEKQQDDLEREEIKDLEIAINLFKDGYFSQSIVETFKVLELHLYRLLQNHGFRIQRFNFIALRDTALKNNLINSEDAKNIDEIKNIRNGAVHIIGIENSKAQSQKAIDIVSALIKNNANEIVI